MEEVLKYQYHSCRWIWSPVHVSLNLICKTCLHNYIVLFIVYRYNNTHIGTKYDYY